MFTHMKKAASDRSTTITHSLFEWALSEAYDARLEVEIAAFEARQNDLSLKLMGL